MAAGVAQRCEHCRVLPEVVAVAAGLQLVDQLGERGDEEGFRLKMGYAAGHGIRKAGAYESDPAPYGGSGQPSGAL